MFWFTSFLVLLFLTPIGWVGMMCFSAGIAMIIQSCDDPYSEYKNRVKGEYLNKVDDILSEADSVEEARKKINGI